MAAAWRVFVECRRKRSPQPPSDGTAESRRQLRAVQKKLHDELVALRLGRPRTEGADESAWILVDFHDVVVHVFLEETRGFYALDRLWGDAPLVSMEGSRARD